MRAAELVRLEMLRYIIDAKRLRGMIALTGMLACACIPRAHAEEADTPDSLMALADSFRSSLPGGGSQPPRSRQEADLYLELAVTLQRLNHLRPNGGKRIAEAEHAYRLDATELQLKALHGRA